MSDKVSRQRDFVVADGHRLRVERLDPGSGVDGPWLVFLHEGLGSIPQWGEFPAALCAASGLPGLVYERWGFGESDRLVLPRPLDYLHQEATRALPAVLDACGIDACIPVGHSDGASIALLYAAHVPGQVRGVVSVAAHVVIEELTLSGIRDAGHAFYQGSLRERLARYHGDNTETMFRGWHETWLQPEFRHWQMLDRLPAIRCPVLAIQGEGDEYGTPGQVDAIVRGVSGPVEGYMVPDCGHIPHRQQADRVLAKITDFLRQLRED